MNSRPSLSTRTSCRLLLGRYETLSLAIVISGDPSPPKDKLLKVMETACTAAGLLISYPHLSAFTAMCPASAWIESTFLPADTSNSNSYGLIPDASSRLRVPCHHGPPKTAPQRGPPQPGSLLHVCGSLLLVFLSSRMTSW